MEKITQLIQFDHFGDPSQLHLAERPQPTADAENAVVRIEAASVNPSDAKNVAGRMSQTTLPRVSGRDYSGVVVLDDPDEWLGQEVWGTGGDVGFTRDGTHTEYIVVPRASLVRKPSTLSHEEAGSVGVTFVTAWCDLEYAALGKNETVAIIGSTGGVGSAVVQIAKRIGARVLAIDRSRLSGEGQPAGAADLILDSGDPNLGSTLRSFNGGLGADVVFNTVGGRMVDVGVRLLHLEVRSF
jgi:NADPH2:quinone reductase